MKIKLETVCKRIYAGGDVPKSSFSEVKTDQYNIPIYANAEKNEGLYGYTDVPRETELSITVAARGTIGYTVIRREPFLPVVRLITIVPDLSKVSERYLYYLIKNCKPQSSGTSIPQLTVPDIKKTLLDDIGINEQELIANKLDKVSRIIDLRKQELQRLDELIKARFVELFGYLMENPFNWPMKTIADVSLFLKSGLSRKLSDEDIGLPVIRSGNIQNGQFIFDNVKYWYKDDPQGANTKDYVLEDGDVLVNFINSSSQIGKTAIYRDTGRDCIYTTNIFRMKLADNCNEYYYNWFAMSDYYYRHLQNIIQPAVNQSSFTTVNFLKLPIPLPAKDKQNEFAEFVKQVDKSKVVVQKSLAETQLLFDKLMQDYFG